MCPLLPHLNVCAIRVMIKNIIVYTLGTKLCLVRSRIVYTQTHIQNNNIRKLVEKSGVYEMIIMYIPDETRNKDTADDYL